MMAKIQIIQPDSGPSAGQAGLAKFSKETSSISVLDAYAGRGGKSAQAFFFSKHEPHISQRRNPSSSFSLEAGTGVLLQAEQNKKGVEVNLCSVNTTTPPPPVPLVWLGKAASVLPHPGKQDGK